jgi:hypothetical protein
MIISVDDRQASAILGAMHAVGVAHHGELTDADRRTIESAGRIVLGRPELTAEEVPPAAPSELAATVLSPDEALQAVRMLAVMSLVDGRLDRDKTDLVQEYAGELDVDADFVDILAEAAADEVAAAAACLIRKNAQSFPNLDITGIDADAVAPFLPYRDGHVIPELEARYETLGDLDEDSFGYAFYAHFKHNGFAFPGNENGMAEAFTTPHDSSHVLSGYSTSQQGELCVSTFIGAMHPDHPMSAEVLPVLFSWHLGIKLNDIAYSSTGMFEPVQFWTAWDRGAATTVDVVDEDWDFWGATTVTLEELRAQYGVEEADPALVP